MHTPLTVSTPASSIHGAWVQVPYMGPSYDVSSSSTARRGQRTHITWWKTSASSSSYSASALPHFVVWSRLCMLFGS